MLGVGGGWRGGGGGGKRGRGLEKPGRVGEPCQVLMATARRRSSPPCRRRPAGHSAAGACCQRWHQRLLSCTGHRPAAININAKASRTKPTAWPMTVGVANPVTGRVVGGLVVIGVIGY